MSRIPLMGSTALLTLALALTATLAEAAPTKKKKPAEGALPEVVVTADKTKAAPAEAGISRPLGAFTLTGEPLAEAAAASSDTAAALTAVPGVQVATGGGVSSLPVMRGLADDRINVLTMGMAITSACGNHMNPPLSYVDPSRIGKVEVLAGVTPVSKGGDSIAGTIIVEKAAPKFAGDASDANLPGLQLGNGVVAHGSVSTFWRSNGNVLGGALNASVSNAEWSLEYDGSGSKGQNYTAGGGKMVYDSLFATQNHALRLAKKTDNGLLTIEGGYQDIPYQGFPNVRMDMLYNHAGYVNARYEGQFDWGKLDAKAFWQHTQHYMNFLADKMATHVDAVPSGGMPMYTDGSDVGWSVKGEIPIGRADTLRIGNELHYTTLDEWWPPVSTSIGGMGNETYVNMNGATRLRVGTFAEWEHVWSKEWTTLLGVRNDTVHMDTGDVKGYNSYLSAACATDPNSTSCMWHYADDAAAFNAKNHAKTDVNFDVTALARWTPNQTFEGEVGYARKTRSPNFYERYAWSTSGMSASMISWSGDANGYVGNIDLKPEVANTFSTTAKFHDAAKSDWEVTVTPWISYVQDFIDADRTAGQPGMFKANQPQFVLLQFANHDALLWGVDASGKVTVAKATPWGSFDLTGSLSYTRGRNLDSNSDLYRIMPLDTKIGLAHRLDGWSNRLELEMVAAKTAVDSERNELKTPGYALLNWRTGYEWKNFRIEVGVDNILDQKYLLPLGGVDWTDYKTQQLAGVSAASRVVDGVYGPGRSFWIGASARF